MSQTTLNFQRWKIYHCCFLHAFISKSTYKRDITTRRRRKTSVESSNKKQPQYLLSFLFLFIFFMLSSFSFLVTTHSLLSSQALFFPLLSCHFSLLYSSQSFFLSSSRYDREAPRIPFEGSRMTLDINFELYRWRIINFRLHVPLFKN